MRSFDAFIPLPRFWIPALNKHYILKRFEIRNYYTKKVLAVKKQTNISKLLHLHSF